MQDFQSLVVALDLFNCHMWDLVPWSGIEPGPPALVAQNLSYWTTRKVPWPLFQNITDWDLGLVESWRREMWASAPMLLRWPSHLASLNPSSLTGWMTRTELQTTWRIKCDKACETLEEAHDTYLQWLFQCNNRIEVVLWNFFFFNKSDLRMLFMPRSWVFWQKGNSADKQDKGDWQVLGKRKRGEERLSWDKKLGTEGVSKSTCEATSLVVQWLRLWAPNAGAQDWSLIRELDFTCCN